jgi:hypothetical protein
MAGVDEGQKAGILGRVQAGDTVAPHNLRHAVRAGQQHLGSCGQGGL